MIVARSIAIAITLFVSGVLAAQESRYVYALRSHDFEAAYSSTSGQGIWRIDPLTGASERMRPLYRDEIDGMGTGLAAFEDRLVVQGTNYLEFDLTTMRLLRRYRGFREGTGTWLFKGPIITPAMSETLGLPAGVYGYPACPPRGGNISYCGELRQLPGYEDGVPNQVQYRFLHRRPIRPQDDFLELAARLEPNAHRNITLDFAGKQFWTWRTFPEGFQYSIRVSTLSVLPIRDGSIAPESPVLEERLDVVNGSQETPRLTRALGFHHTSNSMLQLFEHDRNRGRDFRLIRRDAATLQEVMLERSTSYPVNTPTALTDIPQTVPRTFEQVLPAIGLTPGANGTFWRSDVWFYNSAQLPMNVDFRRVAKPQVTRAFTIPARGSVAMANVLAALGGGPAEMGGDGITIDALVISSTYRRDAQLRVSSRTYTTGPSGTYGQAVPAVPSLEGYSNHLPEFTSNEYRTTYPHWVLDKRDPGAFRHNMGVVNDGATPLTIRLRYGSAEHEREIVVTPHSVQIVNLESLFGSAVVATQSPYVLVAASRPAPLWLSMVDNRTGDATFLPYTLFEIRADQTRLAIPAVGHTAGANGTLWRSDLIGYFPAVDQFEPNNAPSARFFPSGGECGGPASTALVESQNPGIFSDIARQFPQCTGESSLLGTMDLSVNAWTAGYVRTYTTRTEDGGTYGDMLPFYPSNGWPEQHFAGILVNPGYRVNLGVYNGADETASVTFSLHTIEGALAAEQTRNLSPRGFLQLPLSSIFNAIPSGTYGLTVRSSAGTWAYVSTIDNSSGDPFNWW